MKSKQIMSPKTYSSSYSSPIRGEHCNPPPILGRVNERRIYGGCTFPFTRTFLISDLILQDTKQIFCQCYQNYFRCLWLKTFIFQMRGRLCPWHLKWKVVSKRGVCQPLQALILRYFFRHIGHGKQVKHLVWTLNLTFTIIQAQQSH